MTRGFQMYFQGQDAATVVGKEGYEAFLEETVDKLYPLRPERIFTLGTLHTGAGGKKAAETGLGLVPKPQGPLADAVDRLKREGLWESKNWLADHPLAEMKTRINELLEEEGAVNLQEAWELLMGPPYGLRPSRIGVMLFAFLLRDYIEGYYYDDGNRCEGLNANTLAALIERVIKGSKGADSYEIRRMLPAEERACALLREIFGLPGEEASYLRSALIALRNHLKKLGYPLWALRYTNSQPCPEALSLALEALQVLLAGDLEGGVPEREQVEALENWLVQAAQPLKSLASSKSCYVAGMRCFLEQRDPALMEMAARLGLGMDRLMEKLRALLQEDVAFWEEEKVQEQMVRVGEECRVTIALNELCSGSARELSQALHYLRQEWVGNFGRLPLWLLAEVTEGEVKKALDLLRELFEAKSFDLTKNLDRLSSWAARAETLLQGKELIRRSLSDQASALYRWVQKNLVVKLSLEDAAGLLEKLPDLREARHDEIRSHVHRHLAELERLQLICDLRRRYQEITGSPSPAQWSENTGFPAYLLVDKSLGHLLDLLDQPENKSENELREVQNVLEARKEVLDLFRDAEWVKRTFLERVVGDYAGLVDRFR
ncbi:MAG: hypothetical protein QHH75_14955 [Bacillota bacterium]|nr:hypothetical protein [Bacillota bacterium]